VNDDIVKTIAIKESGSNYDLVKIRLDYHNLTLPKFLRYCIAGMIAEDPGLIEFIERIREKKRSKVILNKVEKQNKKAKEITNLFSLKNDEIERIFDLIEQDHPDL
jgi:hypothetical protein